MISDSLHKTSLYEEESFPLTMFTITQNECVPPGPGYNYLHWHDDLQFTLVTKGTLSIQVNGTQYHLKAGEAIFINCGLLHRTNHLSDHGEYISFNFPPKLLSVFSGSLLEREYVLPFTTNYSFPIMLFSPEVNWHITILNHLWELKELNKAITNYGVKYKMVILLMNLWIEFLTNAKDSITTPKKSFLKKQAYLQEMISFIHLNYKNDLSLSTIASAAHISVGECCRCFKNTLHITPYEYLLNFRISKSTELLRDTNYSISVIAGLIGFNHSSHFIQSFKKKMNVTPNEYRNQKLH